MRFSVVWCAFTISFQLCLWNIPRNNIKWFCSRSSILFLIIKLLWVGWQAMMRSVTSTSRVLSRMEFSSLFMFFMAFENIIGFGWPWLLIFKRSIAVTLKKSTPHSPSDCDLKPSSHNNNHHPLTVWDAAENKRYRIWFFGCDSSIVRCLLDVIKGFIP